ncbi:acyltransferase family protein [Rhodoferax aquaticus]|uniref:Acyltransferase n=1 Tax=Rhodoferax aquaticus TaxID=2527691 RepID=A0A515ENT2_9BURK|nr:acyltransferase family protein [Rhodoferax aquaticus]QDL54295.1 acyltransferase [Rhodoferax aquaticus]
MSQQNYRADVDGLRAIAILFVVLYHGYPSEFNGGQIGVDVFFVISGYLITGLIIDDVSKNRFHLTTFYARRIRRIFPALITVLFSCMALGWFTLLSVDFEQLGRQVIAGALFSANFLFWNDVGYFDIAAEKKPLLHLWSLGVEEQFYIAFPIIFVYIRKNFKIIFFAVLLLTSLALYMWIGSVNPSSAFYLPHTRFWQILSGSVLILMQREYYKPSKRLENAASFFGVVVLILSLYTMRGPVEFASYRSIFPVIAAMLFLYGQSSWINGTILSCRPMVLVGKISFPLYLWHWVLLSFCHIFEDSKPFIEVRNPALILSFLLAFATYWFIEQPVRFGRWSHYPTSILSLPLFFVLIIGGWVYFDNGVPQRAAAQVSQLNSGDIGQQGFLTYLRTTAHPCAERGWVAAVNEKGVSSRCAQNHSSSESPAYVLLGDSHAEHLFPGLAEQFPKTALAYTTREGLPLTSNPGFREIFSAIAADHSVKGVLLSAHWASKLQDADHIRFHADLRATLDYLTGQGKAVYLLDDVPIFPFNAERCAYADRFFVSNMCTASKGSVTHTPLNLADNISNPLVLYLNLEKYICNEHECHMAREARLLYRDRNHLNLNGSRYVAWALHAEYPKLFP